MSFFDCSMRLHLHESVSVQLVLAAISKLKAAVNFRQWTARGKGLVLLNILVKTASFSEKSCPADWQIAMYFAARIP